MPKTKAPAEASTSVPSAQTASSPSSSDSSTPYGSSRPGRAIRDSGSSTAPATINLTIQGRGRRQSVDPASLLVNSEHGWQNTEPEPGEGVPQFRSR